MERKIYVTYGRDAKAMALALLQRADVASRVAPGKSIALKPNLVVGKPPEEGATTHAGILEACIEYFLEHGHKDIAIMEGSWVGDRTERGIRACGYDKLGAKYNIPVYDLKKDATRKVKTPIGDIAVCARALDAGYMISLPVLKGHCQTVMTCALKNSKGCLPDHEKRHFHALGLHEPIAALAAAFKPDLFIVDSLCGDLNFEEGGTPVQTDRMFLGDDPVQLDAYGCRLMGIEPERVEYIGLAERYGAGKQALAPEDLIELNSPSPSAAAFPPPSGLVARLTRSVRADKACSACMGNLVHALYRLEQEYHVTWKQPLCIGQGYRQTAPDMPGVGNCCAACPHVPGCPPSAEDILQFLLEQSGSEF